MNWENIIVFIGGLQGFTLGVFLWTKGKKNINAYISFCLFLGSLTVFNTLYIFIYNQIMEVALLPIPYKYIIGVGAFLYIQSQFSTQQKRFFSRWFYLFIPALLYGLLKLYWWLLSLTSNPNILKEIYDTGFFSINELFYLLLNITLGLVAVRNLNRYQKNNQKSATLKKIKWLKTFVFQFLVFTGIHLILFTYISIVGDTDPTINYYLILFLNSIYIYYLGYLGFTQQQNLFTIAELQEGGFQKSEAFLLIEKALKEKELFKQPSLTLAEFAVLINMPTKQVSETIGASGMNFSEYLNTLRVEEVKKLLKLNKHQNLTMEALAKEAGFNSKTTFNTCFKKVVGLTPSAYLKEIKE